LKGPYLTQKQLQAFKERAKANILTSFDNNLKPTASTPSEAKTKSSLPDNCECNDITIQYKGCDHTVQTINPTSGCAMECAYKYSSEHAVWGACPDCSAHSRLMGNDKENQYDSLKGFMSDDSMDWVEIVAKKLKEQE
jgi:hypothetical protein